MYHFHLFTNPGLQKIMGFIKDLSDPNCKFLKSYHRGPPTRFDIPAIKKKILLTIWGMSKSTACPYSIS